MNEVETANSWSEFVTGLCDRVAKVVDMEILALHCGEFDKKCIFHGKPPFYDTVCPYRSFPVG